MPFPRRGVDSRPDDPWGFGAPDGRLVEPPDEAAVEAAAEPPADLPEAPSESVRPWAASAAPPVPAAAKPSLPERVREVARPTTGTRPPHLWHDSGQAPDSHRERADDPRLHPEPTVDPPAHLSSRRRRTRHLATVAAVLGAIIISGAAGYFWIASGPDRGSAAEPELGTFVLSSQPPGAQVDVDGVPAGATPLALQLTPGAHVIVATGANGTVERLSATVAPGKSVSRHLMLESYSPSASVRGVDAGGRNGAARAAVPARSADRAAVSAVAPPPPGFVTFAVPFDVQIYEAGELMSSKPGERMRVHPGTHTFTLVNDDLGFRGEETVIVGAGRSTRRVVEQHSAPLSINALPWAEVLIAGRNFGETPLANISLPIGTYQVTLRHPTLGEREVAVTVRLGSPNRLAVDLRR